MEPDYILRIDSVSKSFARRGDSSLRVLDNFDILIPKAKITAMIGGNGTGKTTLFNIISGLCRTDCGEITYSLGNREIPLLKQKAYRIPRLGIGRLFQTSRVFENLTILDNLLLGHYYGASELPFYNLFRPVKLKKMENEISKRAEQLIASLFDSDSYLWDHRYEPARNLSYGQKRLLEILRLFMGGYQLLLLDEPTAGVSPALCESITQMLKTVTERENISIFLIEHNMTFVSRTADLCQFINKGRIQNFGTPQDVLSDPEVKISYAGV